MSKGRAAFQPGRSAANARALRLLCYVVRGNLRKTSLNIMNRCFINACVASITLGTLLTPGPGPGSGRRRATRRDLTAADAARSVRADGPRPNERPQPCGALRQDGNEWLNAEERKAPVNPWRNKTPKAAAPGVLAALGRDSGDRRSREEDWHGRRRRLSKRTLYDPHILRTLFFEFEMRLGEGMEEFYGSDVEVRQSSRSMARFTRTLECASGAQSSFL